MSKKSCLFAYRELSYKNGQDFLGTQFTFVKILCFRFSLSAIALPLFIQIICNLDCLKSSNAGFNRGSVDLKD